MAGVLIMVGIALAAAPTASAATAPHPAAPAALRVVLAGPAPTPSPSPSDPGIGLGPGAPTGAPTAPSPITTSDPGTGASPNPSWWDVPGQIQKAIDDWFGSLVTDALTPMLNLLGSTLLGTPDVTAMPRVKSLWTQMALLANAFYILLVLAGAVIVMTHGSTSSRNSAKEIVPRLLVGMIAGNASIALLAVMIHLSDALASAILGGTINPATAGQALGHMLGPAARNGIFLILLDLGAQVMLIAILLTYIVRVALTVVLAVAAPLALSLHALPQTEPLAKLWWRAITGCFLIQLGQSLVFVVGLDVMLDPTTSISLFGLPNNSALVDTLVFLALCWILIKIPSWVSRSIFGAGSSKLARLAKAVVAYKTLGALGLKRGPGGIPVRTATPPNRPRPGAGGAGWGGPPPGGRGPGGPRGGGAGPVIYTVTQVHPNPPSPRGLGGPRPALPPGSRAPSGQGPRRSRSSGAAGGATASPPPGAGTSGGQGPKHRQTVLPIKAERVARPKAPATQPAPGADRPAGQLAGSTRPRHVQPGLFPLPRPKSATAAAQPSAAPSPATLPPARTGARMSAASRPAPAPPPTLRPSAAATGAASSAARMNAAPKSTPPRATPAPLPVHRPQPATTAPTPAAPTPRPASADAARRTPAQARRTNP